MEVIEESSSILNICLSFINIIPWGFVFQFAFYFSFPFLFQFLKMYPFSFVLYIVWHNVSLNLLLFLIGEWCGLFQGFPGGSVVKNPLPSAGDAGDTGSTPGSGRSPGVGNGNPCQYPCLENFMDKGVWQAAIHEVAKSWTQLSTHTQTKKQHLH